MSFFVNEIYKKTIEKNREIVYNSGGVKCSEMSVKWR